MPKRTSDANRTPLRVTLVTLDGHLAASTLVTVPALAYLFWRGHRRGTVLTAAVAGAGAA